MPVTLTFLSDEFILLENIMLGGYIISSVIKNIFKYILNVSLE